MEFKVDPQPITPDAPPSPDSGGSPQFVPDQQPIQFKIDGQSTSQPPSKPSTPTATPHDYDQIILNAAHKHGIDPRVLQAVGVQETGLGRSNNYDPKTGRDLNGNPGHGLWQLDPSSNASPETLARAAHDPRFAADYAAGMIANALRNHHGDLHAALADYNAGAGNMALGKGEMFERGNAYAQQVLGRMDADEPLTLVKKHVEKVIKAMGNSIAHGHSPLIPLSQEPGIRKIVQGEKDVRKVAVDAQANPLEMLGDILQTGERAVGTLHEEAGLHGGLIQAYKDYIKDPNSVGHEVRNRLEQNIWHPTPARRKALDEAEQRDSVFNDLDRFIHTNTWMTPEIRKKTEEIYHSEGSKGVQSFLNQVINDPLTFGLGGAVAHGVGWLGSHGLGAAGGVAQAAFHLLGRDAQWQHLADWANNANEIRNGVFGVRHDLDLAGFTPEGKNARLGIENAAASRHAQRVNRAHQVIHNGTEAANQYQHVHGTLPVLAHHTAMIQELSDHATTPARRLEILQAQAKGRLTSEIADHSDAAFSNNRSLYTGNVLNLRHISHTPGMHEAFPPAVQRGINAIQTLGKKAIFWNPLPHSINNVGTNVYMAGGLPAITHGLRAMAGKLDPVDLSRIRDMGALPEYVSEHVNGRLSQLGQGTMEHVEAGWRIGLMHYLDETMGVPKNAVEKFIRGQLINHKVGDYRNQSAFVQMFKALGGPFVAFRLGIAPRLVMETLIHHPERISQLINAQQHTGYDFGGPVHDAAQLAVDPAKFLAKTGGPITSLGDPQYGGQGWLDSLSQLGANYFGGLNLIGNVISNIGGSEQVHHGQATVTDMLKDELMNLITGAYHGQHEKPKTIQNKKRQIQKGSF